MKPVIYPIILVAMLAQGGSLEEDRFRAEKDNWLTSVVSIRAVYEDGTPVHKGWIRCDGDWWLHADREPEEDLEGNPIWTPPVEWFKTDSRGTVAFNNYSTGRPMNCQARKDGLTGSIEFYWESESISTQLITVR